MGIAAAAWTALKDNEAISRAWKCLLLWRISILGGAFKQEEAREKKKKKKKWRVYTRYVLLAVFGARFV